jgi:hypothetical protein
MSEKWKSDLLMSENGKSGIGKRDDLNDDPDSQSEREDSPSTLVDDRQEVYALMRKAVE